MYDEFIKNISTQAKLVGLNDNVGFNKPKRVSTFKGIEYASTPLSNFWEIKFPRIRLSRKRIVQSGQVHRKTVYVIRTHKPIVTKENRTALFERQLKDAQNVTRFNKNIKYFNYIIRPSRQDLLVKDFRQGKVEQVLKSVATSKAASFAAYAACPSLGFAVDSLLFKPKVEKILDSVDDSIQNLNTKFGNLSDQFSKSANNFDKHINKNSENLNILSENINQLLQKQQKSVENINTIIEACKRNYVGIISQLYSIYNVNTIDMFCANLISLLTLCGVDQLIIDNIFSKLNPILNQTFDQQQIGSSEITMMFTIFGSLFKAFDAKSFISKFMSFAGDFTKNKTGFDELLKMVEDFAQSHGFGWSERAKFVSELKQEIGEILEQTAEYETLANLNGSVFCKDNYWKPFNIIRDKIRKIEIQLATQKFKNFVSTTMNVEIVSLARRIDKLYSLISDIRSRNGQRVKPVGICFLGESQIGKSTLAPKFHHMILNEMNRRVQLEPENSNRLDNFLDVKNWTVWAEQNRDQYDTGYEGNEIHFVDDAFMDKEEKDHNKYITFMSSNRIGTVMAQIEQKGKPYQAKIVHVCCNQFPTSSATIKNIEALANRFGVFVHVTTRPNIPFDPVHFDHLEFHVQTGQNYFNQRSDDDLHCQNGACYPEKYMSLPELVSHVCDKLVLHDSYFNRNNDEVFGLQRDIRQGFDEFSDAEEEIVTKRDIYENSQIYKLTQTDNKGFSMLHHKDAKESARYSVLRKLRVSEEYINQFYPNYSGPNTYTELATYDIMLYDPECFYQLLLKGDVFYNYDKLDPEHIFKKTPFMIYDEMGVFKFLYFADNLYVDSTGYIPNFNAPKAGENVFDESDDEDSCFNPKATFRTPQQINKYTYEQDVIKNGWTQTYLQMLKDRHQIIKQQFSDSYPIINWLRTILNDGLLIVYDFISWLTGMEDSDLLFNLCVQVPFACFNVFTPVLILIPLVLIINKIITLAGYGHQCGPDKMQMKIDKDGLIHRFNCPCGKYYDMDYFDWEIINGEFDENWWCKTEDILESSQFNNKSRNRKVQIRESTQFNNQKRRNHKTVRECVKFLFESRRSYTPGGPQSTKKHKLDESEIKLQKVGKQQYVVEEDKREKTDTVTRQRINHFKNANLTFDYNIQLPEEVLPSASYDIQQVCQDPQTQDIINKVIMNNLINIDIVLDTSVQSYHGIGLYDNYVIAPHHGVSHNARYFGSFKSNFNEEYFEMELIKSRLVWDLAVFRVMKKEKFECVETVTRNGVIRRFNLGKQNTQFTDIRKFIPLDADNFFSATRTHVGIQVLSKQIKTQKKFGTQIINNTYVPVHFQYEETYEPSFHGSDESYIHEGIWRLNHSSDRMVEGMEVGNSQTIAGDCGSPLFVMNPGVTQKLVGFHILGSNDKRVTRSTILTMKRINSLLPKDIQQNFSEPLEYQFVSHDPVYYCFDLEKEQPEYLGNGDIDWIGDTYTEYGGGYSIKRENHKSIFYGCFEETKIPSVLSINDDRIEDVSSLSINANGNYDILLTQVDQYRDTSHFPIDMNRLQFMVKSLIKYSLPIFKNLDIGFCDYQTALSGDNFQEGFDHMNLKSSNGLPYNILGAKTGRNIWDCDFNVINRNMGNLVYARTMWKFIQAQKSVRTMSIWKNCLKDELRKPGKIATANTRMFTACPRETTILSRMLFGRYKAEWQNNSWDLFHAVGINPHSTDWRKLYYMLVRKPYYLDEDFKNFDKAMPSQFMEAAGEIIIETIHQRTGESDALKRARWTIWDEYIRTVSISRTTVSKKRSGNCSGNPMTTVLNCWVNFMYHWYAFLELYPGTDLQYFIENVKIFCFGDDVIQGVSRFVADKYNFENISSILSTIGQTVTPASKDSSQTGWRSIYDIQFLKRLFKINHRGIIVAPLERESILASFSWTSICDDDFDNWYVHIHETLFEISLYGKSTYDNFRRTLRNFINDKDFDEKYPFLYKPIMSLCNKPFSVITDEYNARYFNSTISVVYLKSNNSIVTSCSTKDKAIQSDLYKSDKYEIKTQTIDQYNKSIINNNDFNFISVNKHIIPKSSELDLLAMSSKTDHQKVRQLGDILANRVLNTYCQFMMMRMPYFEEFFINNEWVVETEFANHKYKGRGNSKQDAKMDVYNQIVETVLYNQPDIIQRLEKSFKIKRDEQQMMRFDTTLRSTQSPTQLRYSGGVDNSDPSGEAPLHTDDFSTDPNIYMKVCETADGPREVFVMEPQLTRENPQIVTDFWDYPNSFKNMQFIRALKLGDEKVISFPIRAFTNDRLGSFASIFKFIRSSYIVKLIAKVPIGFNCKVKVSVRHDLDQDTSVYSRKGMIWDLAQTSTIYLEVPYINENYMLPFNGVSAAVIIQPLGKPSNRTDVTLPIDIGYHVQPYNTRLYIKKHYEATNPSEAQCRALYPCPPPTEAQCKQLYPCPPCPPPIYDEQQIYQYVDGATRTIYQFKVIDFPVITKEDFDKIPNANEYLTLIPCDDNPENINKFGLRFKSTHYINAVNKYDKALGSNRLKVFPIYKNYYYHASLEYYQTQIVYCSVSAPNGDDNPVYQDLSDLYETVLEDTIGISYLIPLDKAAEDLFLAFVSDKMPNGTIYKSNPKDTNYSLVDYKFLAPPPPEKPKNYYTNLEECIDEVLPHIQETLKRKFRLAQEREQDFQQVGEASQPDAANPELNPGNMAGQSSGPNTSAMAQVVGTNTVNVEASHGIFVPINSVQIVDNWPGLTSSITPYSWTIGGTGLSHALVEAGRHWFCGPSNKSNTQFATYKVTSTGNAFQNARFIIAQIPPGVDGSKMTASELTQYPHKEHHLHGPETVFPTQWMLPVPVMIPRQKQNNGTLCIQMLENSLTKDNTAPVLTLWVEASNIEYSIPAIPLMTLPATDFRQSGTTMPPCQKCLKPLWFCQCSCHSSTRQATTAPCQKCGQAPCKCTRDKRQMKEVFFMKKCGLCANSNCMCKQPFRDEHCGINLCPDCHFSACQCDGTFQSAYKELICIKCKLISCICVNPSYSYDTCGHEIDVICPYCHREPCICYAKPLKQAIRDYQNETDGTIKNHNHWVQLSTVVGLPQ